MLRRMIFVQILVTFGNSRSSWQKKSGLRETSQKQYRFIFFAAHVSNFQLSPKIARTSRTCASRLQFFGLDFLIYFCIFCDFTSPGSSEPGLRSGLLFSGSLSTSPFIIPLCCSLTIYSVFFVL